MPDRSHALIDITRSTNEGRRHHRSDLWGTAGLKLGRPGPTQRGLEALRPLRSTGETCMTTAENEGPKTYQDHQEG